MGMNDTEKKQGFSLTFAKDAYGQSIKNRCGVNMKKGLDECISMALEYVEERIQKAIKAGNFGVAIEQDLMFKDLQCKCNEEDEGYIFSSVIREIIKCGYKVGIRLDYKENHSHDSFICKRIVAITWFDF